MDTSLTRRYARSVENVPAVSVRSREKKVFFSKSTMAPSIPPKMTKYENVAQIQIATLIMILSMNTVLACYVVVQYIFKPRSRFVS